MGMFFCKVKKSIRNCSFLFFFVAYSWSAVANPVVDMYSTVDWGSFSIFSGGFINFGYWKDIPLKNGIAITEKERTASSVALYDLITDLGKIKPTDHVLEVGCGRGYGVLRTYDRFHPAKLDGIDITPQQIEKVQLLHRDFLQKNASVNFSVASAEASKFPDHSFDKIYTVEAAQHFPSMPAFALEAARILKPGGRLVFTAHFSTSPDGYQEVRKRIPSLDQGIDRMIPIQMVRSAFADAGFKEKDFFSISDDVFEGFEKWVTGVGPENEWTHDVYRLYKEGHLGYYVLVLELGS
ncbi:class I SAM-dependent methyltransferase [Simkania negevensis]|uniref:Class I SAM-dependent methyltransferase n=1 Tax=Simkania negevensis TaxID=83561 RepID=A0ABS3AQ00_9BACT|nr:class I SAM-dependent methyltransferase [Simkania negevensis]